MSKPYEGKPVHGRRSAIAYMILDRITNPKGRYNDGKPFFTYDELRARRYQRCNCVASDCNGWIAR